MARRKPKAQAKWQVEWIDVDSIVPYENNARNNDHTVPYLIKSIKRFGFRVPLVIDAENIIICGHTRLKAALEIGLKSIPCVRANDLTKQEIKAFRLADNKITEMSEWDSEKLESELWDISTFPDIDMADFGFDDSEQEDEEEKQGEEEESKYKVTLTFNRLRDVSDFVDAYKVELEESYGVKITMKSSK